MFRSDADRRALFVTSIIAKMVPGLREEDKRLWERFQWHVLLEDFTQQVELHVLYDRLQTSAKELMVIDVDEAISFE